MKNWQGALRGAVFLALAGVFGGCSVGPKATEQPASYDLGPQSAPAAGKPGIPGTLFLPEVSAPVWLGGNGIIYRLNFESAARAQSYTLSRWTAPPAALLTQRMRTRFASAAARGIVVGQEGVPADHLLRIDLEDFSQSFDTPKTSRVAVRARASLVALGSRALVAQQVFTVEKDAPTPDAAGAVQALGAASDEFVENLLRWTEDRLKGAKSR